MEYCSLSLPLLGPLSLPPSLPPSPSLSLSTPWPSLTLSPPLSLYPSPFSPSLSLPLHGPLLLSLILHYLRRTCLCFCPGLLLLSGWLGKGLGTHTHTHTHTVSHR